MMAGQGPRPARVMRQMHQKGIQFGCTGYLDRSSDDPPPTTASGRRCSARCSAPSDPDSHRPRPWWHGSRGWVPPRSQRSRADLRPDRPPCCRAAAPAGSRGRPRRVAVVRLVNDTDGDWWCYAAALVNDGSQTLRSEDPRSPARTNTRSFDDRLLPVWPTARTRGSSGSASVTTRTRSPPAPTSTSCPGWIRLPLQG